MQSHAPNALSRRRDDRAAARALSVALIRLRTAAGYSQYALARESGVSRSTINSLESGQGGALLVRTLRLLATALGVTPDALLGCETKR